MVCSVRFDPAAAVAAGVVHGGQVPCCGADEQHRFWSHGPRQGVAGFAICAEVAAKSPSAVEDVGELAPEDSPGRDRRHSVAPTQDERPAPEAGW